MIKDRQGRDQLVLSDEDFYNDNIMGEKLEDYEILQVLTKDKNPSGFMSKVRSKSNSKIYVMKKIESKYSPNSNKQNFKKEFERFKEEFERFKKINSPNITKYFKYFFYPNSDSPDSCLFVLFEYVNNCDLQDLFNTYKNLEKPIDTKTLWNIFMQCITALKDIHSKNIIHKNIKLSNIFMSENNIIKLGDFRFSFLECEPDLLDNKYLTEDIKNNNNLYYNEKTDIYAMGIVFHQLCYFTHIINLPDYKKNKGIYPKKMEDIIQSMINKDENKIPDTNKLYEIIMEEYINNAAKITSIDSVFRCMYSFKNFTTIMDQKALSFLDVKETPICYNYINCIQNYSNQEENNAKYLNNFRNLLYKDTQINNEIEIKPSLVIDFLLENLNKEMGTDFNSQSSLVIQTLDKTLTDFSIYMKSFKEKYKSEIIDYFIGFLKIIKKCKKCKKSSNSFNFFPYIEFNLDIFDKYPNFENWFKEQNEHYIDLSEEYCLKCSECQKVTPQREFKNFLKLPQNLIILLNENEGFKEPEKINFPLNLDLSQTFKEIDSNNKFNLVGLVKRIIKDEDEYYISIYLDPNSKSWIISDCKNLTKIDNPLKHNEGMILLLFYSVIVDIGG